MTTSTAPAAWAGVLAVIVVELTTEILVADVPPKVTELAPMKFVPVMVTLVTPTVEPEVGAMLTKDGGATYVYAPVPVAVPLGVVMTTSTTPAVWAGVLAVIVVSLTTERLVADVPPKVADVAPIRDVPVIVTLVTPVVRLKVGAMLTKVGGVT